MDQFHGRGYVWLRSRVHGTYLHADEDGHGVSLSRRRASMNAAWVVHRYYRDDQHVLLHSAAYGRYLTATGASPPRGCRGFRVEQRNYNELEEGAIMWRPVQIRDDILLRHAGNRANEGYLRSNENDVSADDFDNISTMLHWVVEPITTTERMPRLPRPMLGLHLAGSFAALLPWREVVFMANGERFCTNKVSFVFRGRSVLRLRSVVASRLGIRRVRDIHDDLIMYVRAGRYGQFTQLVVDLPHNR